MNAETRLEDLFREWRRLAEAEAEGIRRHYWPLVADCQTALRQIQPLITRHTLEAREHWSHSGPNSSTTQRRLHAALLELLTLQTHNRDLLESERQTARCHLDRLQQAGRTLRRLHQFYPPSRTAGWHSVS
jgi:hypothetical protein